MENTDQHITDPFFAKVDQAIRTEGAKQIAETERIFRIARCANGSGVDYSEIRRVLEGITSLATWYDAWKKSADRFAGLAEEAERKGRLVTAGGHWFRAGLLYHYAQLFTRSEDPRRVEGQAKRVAYYVRACPMLRPAIEPVRIPYGSLKLPGYLRLPQSRTGRVPVVIMIPGANSVKEELHHWAQWIVDRGVATLSMDGPGQGAMSVANGGVPTDLTRYHEAMTAACDYVATRPELDVARVGLLGQSTGGNLALGAAAHEHRFKALVSLGGGYDFRGKTSPTTTPVDVREEARDLYGLTSFDALSDYIARCGSLKGLIGKIRCPVLLIHSGKDILVPQEEIDAIKKEITAPCESLYYEDMGHSITGRNIEMSAAMADWVVEKLAA
jgi:2,6-dihydroxypseudooxynicotine hydrolase